MLAVMRTCSWILLLVVSLAFLHHVSCTSRVKAPKTQDVTWPICDKCRAHPQHRDCKSCLTDAAKTPDCDVCQIADRDSTSVATKQPCVTCNKNMDTKCGHCTTPIVKDCVECNEALGKSTKKCEVCNRLQKGIRNIVRECKTCTTTAPTPPAATTTPAPKWTACEKECMNDITTTGCNDCLYLNCAVCGIPVEILKDKQAMCDQCTVAKSCESCAARGVDCSNCTDGMMNKNVKKCEVCKILTAKAFKNVEKCSECKDVVKDMCAVCEKDANKKKCTTCKAILTSVTGKCDFCNVLPKKTLDKVSECTSCTTTTASPTTTPRITHAVPTTTPSTVQQCKTCAKKTSDAETACIACFKDLTQQKDKCARCKTYNMQANGPCKKCASSSTSTTTPTPTTTTPSPTTVKVPSPVRTPTTTKAETTLATPLPPPDRPPVIPLEITEEPEPATEPPNLALDSPKPNVDGDEKKKDEGTNLTALYVCLGIGAVLLVLAGVGAATGIVVKKKLKNKKNKGSAKSKADLEKALVEAEAHGVAGDVGMALVADLPPVPMPVRRPIHAKRPGEKKTTGPVRQMEAGKIVKTGFAFEGPLTFDATGNHGPLVHATEGQQSHSLRDVFFSDEMNRVFDMGSEIEHVVKSEEHDASKKKSTADEPKKDSKKDSKKNTTPSAPPAPDPNQPPPPPSAAAIK